MLQENIGLFPPDVSQNKAAGSYGRDYKNVFSIKVCVKVTNASPANLFDYILGDIIAAYESVFATCRFTVFTQGRAISKYIRIIF